MSCYWIKGVVLTAVAAVSLIGAESKLDEARTTLEKWVETRQLIGRTKVDWQAGKEMLTQTTQLFDRELQSIQEQMSKVSTNNTQVDKERALANESLQNSKESLDWARERTGKFELQVANLVPRLPAPLQEILRPLLNRMPSDPGSTKMTVAERAQVIVGVLNEIDKFNSAVTIFNEKRTNPKGEEVAVDSVYVGLGVAYFVNSAGDLAGTGAPGPKGWEWTVRPELAPRVQEAIHIYRNERSARFIALPVAIR